VRKRALNLRQTFLEILLLVLAAMVLGFAYTFVTKQGFFAKTQPIPTAVVPHIEMISLAMAKESFESHRALFIDARHEFDFQAGHIRGAVNIALNQYESQRTRLNGISKDTLLIVYCDGAECNSSIELTVKLMDSGFSNVKVFFGGWQEWISAKLPLEK
jgi:rhodanese-related sulfurtransferase